ncbi:MAG: hypothetical protein L0Z48_09035 [candidate division Zixibacteria bacterium]|nr:hypothetical protein [candidate division Zixibacteria bacterium]MCI0596665.1 hypothetical protein [candidate division Zixibacteria bacterium]
MPKSAVEDVVLRELAEKEKAINQRIAELQRSLQTIQEMKRLSLELRQKALAFVSPQRPVPSTPSAPPAPRNGEYADLGAIEAIRRFFAELPEKTWGPADMTRELVLRGWQTRSKNKEAWSSIIGEMLKQMYRRGELSRRLKDGKPVYGLKKGVAKSKVPNFRAISAYGFAKLGPTDATAKLLMEKPGKTWRPAEVVRELLRRGWKAKSKALQSRTSIITATLRSLSRKGLVTSNGKKGDCVYSWKK